MVEVHGTLLSGLYAAGESVKLLLQDALPDQAQWLPDQWYDAVELQNFLIKSRRYSNPAAVLERLGEEMMHAWYEHGPGFRLAPRALDFIALQAGSHGYASVVRGSPGETGRFALESLDEAAGLATIRSTTVFDKHLERGILYGGMHACGDLLYFDVTLRPDGEHFDIRFISAANSETAAWAPRLSEPEWRLRQQIHRFERREYFWISINDTLNEAFAEMRRQATVDFLSGICSRGEFFRRLDIECTRLRRDSAPLSLLYMDLDKFKQINDRYGHSAGDLVIRSFCDSCTDLLRATDIFGRLGGEEFAIALPNASLDAARTVAKRILERVRGLRVRSGDDEIRFTVSIGIASLGSEANLPLLIDLADRRLLIAKKSGRDRMYG
ncbi:MAG TPA: GGDEF domain-containing protein [Paucimonas sp.]|nr:GGDEF domain-containing protein [Paucimonas sp.]